MELVLYIAVLLLALTSVVFILLNLQKQKSLQALQQQQAQTAEQYNALLQKSESLTEQYQLALQEKIRSQTEKQGVESLLQEKNRQQQELEQLNLSAQQQITQLSQQLAALRTSLAEKETHFAEQQQLLENNKKQLTLEFQQLANQILEEKSRSFSQSNQIALDSLLKPFKEQIEGFQKRVNEVHSETVKGNASLEAELKKVLEIGLNMSKEANNLTTALKGQKKTL